MISSFLPSFRQLAIVSVGGFLGVLGYYLMQPGLGWSRMALFAVLGGCAVLGGVGAYRRHTRLTVIGGSGLLLIGGWQPVLTVFVWPVLLLLALSVVTR